jgi:hypothetical protein
MRSGKHGTVASTPSPWTARHRYPLWLTPPRSRGNLIRLVCSRGGGPVFRERSVDEQRYEAVLAVIEDGPLPSVWTVR